MSTATAAATSLPREIAGTPRVAITYLFNGKHVTLLHEAADPQWRHAVQLLRSHGRSFRIRYM